MQISADFKVTNITKYAVILVAAKRRWPERLGMVLIKDLNSQYHGEYQIPPGETTEVSLHFWVVPPVREEGEDYTAEIAILDQFGNQHWAKNNLFRYR
jgi:hypothetical protein